MKTIIRERRTLGSGAGRAIAAAGFCLIAAPVIAAQWEVRPFVDVGAISDDNPLLAPGGGERASGYIAGARLEATGKTELATATINGYVARTLYNESRVDDKTDQRLALNAEKRTSERGTLGLDGEYRREALFETTVLQQGTGDIRDTDVGLSRSTEVRRDYWVLQPWWNWLLTERSAVRVGYRRTASAYRDDTSSGLIDYREDLLSGTYSRQLTPRDDLLLTLNHARYRPEGTDADVDTTQLLVGLARRFTEQTRGSFSLGGSRSAASGVAGDDRSSGLAASATLQHRSEFSTFEGVISRDVTPSGVGRAQRTDQLRVWWSRRLAEDLEFVLDGQFFRNRALSGADPSINRRYYDLTPQLRWHWLEDLAIAASYRYRKQRYDVDADSAESNAVFLGLSYRL